MPSGCHPVSPNGKDTEKKKKKKTDGYEKGVRLESDLVRTAKWFKGARVKLLKWVFYPPLPLD